MKKRILQAVLAIAAVPWFTAPLEAAPILDQEQGMIDLAAGGLAVGGQSSQRLAQVFTPRLSGALTEVALPVGCQSAGFVLEICAVANGVPSGVLASEAFGATNMPPVLAGRPYFRSFRFTQPAMVLAGVSYAIVLRGTGSPAEGCIVYQGPPGDPYAGGDLFFIALPNSPDTWVCVCDFPGARFDLPFLTWVDPSACLPPADGLVAWWKAEGNAQDSATINDGALDINNLTNYYTAGVAGRAFNFRAGFMKVAPSVTLDVGSGSGFTIEGWIRPEKVNGPAKFSLAEWNNGSAWGSLGLGLSFAAEGSNQVALRAYAGPAFSLSSSLGLIQPGIWQHVAMAYDKTNSLLTLYVNATQVAQTNLTGTELPTKANFYLASPYGLSYSGAMDEMRVYSRALSPSEIQAVRSSQTNCLPPPPSCVNLPAGAVAWWQNQSNLLDSVGLNDATSQPQIYGDYTNGMAGVGAHFTGGYRRVPASPALDLGVGPGLTVEGWIKVAPNRSGFLPLIEWNAGNAQIGVGLSTFMALNGGYLEARFRGTNGSQVTFRTSTNILAPDVWTHLALTFNRSSGLAGLYVNGASLVQTNIGDRVLQTKADVYFGYRASGDYTGSRFYGSADEFAIYRRALEPAEIQAIALAHRSGKCSPPPLACLPPLEGIVSWWRGQGDSRDCLGRNDAQMTAGMSFSAGKVGSAFSFTGGPRYLVVPPSASLNVGAGAGFTLEGWFNPWTMFNTPLMEWNDGQGRTGVRLWMPEGGAVNAPGGLTANIIDTLGQSHVLVSGRNALTNNMWQHVALSYDRASGMAAIFVNGYSLARTNLGSFTPQTGYSLYIGYRPVPGSTGTSYTGGMDELSIYNRALTDAEILAIGRTRSYGKCYDPVVITSQPQNLLVAEYQPAAFSVGAAGGEPLSFQWYHNAAPLTGRTASMLHLTNVTVEDGGAYQVVVSNLFGAVSSASAWLTVNRLPVVKCRNQIVAAGPDCLAAAVVDDGSYDPDGDSFTLAATPPGPYPPGTNLVMLTAVDNRGASNSCTAVVVVRDITPPVVTCPADINVTNAHDQAASVVYYQPLVADNCSGAVVTCVPPSGSLFEVGTRLVECVAADAAGNSVRCTFRVTVWPGNQAPVPVMTISPLLSWPASTNLLAVTTCREEARLVLGASLSRDPDGDAFTGAWWADGQWLSTGLTTTNWFAKGLHEIALTLNDGFPGGTASSNLVVEVVSAEEAVSLLMEMVQSSSLPSRTKTPLLATLASSAAALERGNWKAGANTLGAFMNQTRAQVAPAYPELAARFIRCAQALLPLLNCPPE